MIYLRGSTWYTDVYPEGAKGPRTRISTGCKANEKAKAEAIAARLKAGESVEVVMGRAEPAKVAGGISLRDAIDRAWLTEWRELKDKESKRLWSKLILDRFGPGRNLADIDAEDVQDWIDDLLAAGNSNATVNRKTAALSRLFTLARQWGIAINKPYIPHLKERDEGRGFLQPDDIERLIALEPNPDLRALWLFLRDTACRFGEAHALSWENVRGDVAVFADRKGGDSMGMPLSSRCIAELARLKAAGYPRPFPKSYSLYLTRWREACARASIVLPRGTALHITRHTTATELVSSGVSIRTVQAVLGHASVTTTEIYTKLSGSGIKDALSGLKRADTIVDDPDGGNHGHTKEKQYENQSVTT